MSLPLALPQISCESGGGVSGRHISDIPPRLTSAFHGGTSFGFMAGANLYHEFEPHVTSYDYDALLTEVS